MDPKLAAQRLQELEVLAARLRAAEAGVDESLIERVRAEVNLFLRQLTADRGGVDIGRVSKGGAA